MIDTPKMTCRLTLNRLPKKSMLVERKNSQNTKQYVINYGRIEKTCRANQANQSEQGESNQANQTNQIELYCELRKLSKSSELIINLLSMNIQINICPIYANWTNIDSFCANICSIR